MVKCEVTHCFMEVSSHGIDQYRVYAIQFNVGVFTNLSHDHLDYHKSFKNYRDVKKIFFDSLDVSALAISNCDDKNGKFMLQNTKAKKYFFGIKNLGEFKIKVLEKSLEGTLIKINNVEAFRDEADPRMWSVFISLTTLEQDQITQSITIRI
mgnify:CR=1 FL=1